MKKDRFGIRRTVVLALFCAIAYAVTFVFRIKVSFLTFDAKDSIVCIAGMIYGPAASVIVSAVVALLEFLSVSDTGFWGLIMNFVSTAMFSVVSVLVYRRIRSLSGAVVGLLCGVLSGTAMMLVMNLLITPLYLNVDIPTVVGLIPTMLLPFNLIKYTINASVVMALYKPLSSALKKGGFVESDGNDSAPLGRRTVLVIAAACAVAAVCIALFIFVYHGEFSSF